MVRPGEGDASSLLKIIHIKNAHGTRASTIVGKTELLSHLTRKISYNARGIKKFIALKTKDITFGGETFMIPSFRCLRSMRVA